MDIKKNFKNFISTFFHKNFAWCILVALLVLFVCLSQNFLTKRNLLNLLMQNGYLIVLAMGVLFQILSGMLDLSVGYQMSLVGVLTSMMMVKLDYPVGIAMVLGIMIGILLQMINIGVAMIIKLPTIIITMATSIVFQGIAYMITNAGTINGFPDSFLFIGQGFIGPVSMPIILAVFAVMVASFILNKTYIGRYVYALGGNAEAAKLAGINIIKTRLIIAVFTGFFIGLSSLIMISRLGASNAGYGPGSEFTAITALCLGGISIKGGKGSVSGAVAGVLIIAMISNGMQLAGFGTYVQYMVKGLIMLAAFGIDVLQQKRRAMVKIKN